MKIILALFSAAIFVSCGSVCSPTNGACTFGSIDVRSSEINFLSNSNFKNRNYEATVIKDLSPDPILIENIDSELITRESNRPLNLPTNLLQYRPDSYKIGIGDRLFIYVYGETERLSASLVSGAAINPILKNMSEMTEQFFILMQELLMFKVLQSNKFVKNLLTSLQKF